LLDNQKNEEVEAIRTFYDSVYYADARPSASPALLRHYGRLHQRMGLREGSAVLDVACGLGEWLKVCQERGSSVAGVDLSERAIDACRQAMPSGEFRAQAAERLPFADDSFDLVSCLGSLEHFVDPVGSLREMARVARPGAALLLLVPNKDFLTRKLGLFRGTYQVDAKEVVRTLAEWEALFRKAGIEVIERWRDLHVLDPDWIARGSPLTWPLRASQAAVLPLLPLRWQYQVYHHCAIERA
jgi:ubiquinone/menaquinone biosynthesis C-methylase UbiE